MNCLVELLTNSICLARECRPNPGRGALRIISLFLAGGDSKRLLVPGGRSPMSTAGKVLAVLVMLMSLVWMVLSAGVDQLNTNFNKKLYDLGVQLEKLEAQVDQTQIDLVGLKSSASTMQETLDHELAVLRARQSDLEKDRSQIKNSLTHWQFQLDTAKETIDRAKTALQHRTEEETSSQDLLAKTKSDVKELMDRCGELTNELDALRKEFNSTYQANVESLGKTK
jgi:hypothetical protein